ncbi:ferrous iron transport protein B [Deltaproteobacteria bacterium TL4]
MGKMISLRHMKVNEIGTITSINAQGELGRRLRDMGLVKDTEISVIGRAPLKDPVALRLKDFTLTLRNKEADFIDVEVKRDDDDFYGSTEQISLALAGNPNAGKSTIFNLLTGSRQKVGNYPGVTVSKREGRMVTNDLMIKVADLPGTYSLTPYSEEEIAARNHLIHDRPDVIVNVVDSNSLERNLYFTVQLLELGLPVVVALNMIDEVRKKGNNIDCEKLSQILNVPVVETVGRTGVGKSQLVAESIKFAKERKGQSDPLRISYGSDLDIALQTMEKIINDNNFLTDLIPARWTAIKYLENDPHIIGMGGKKDKKVNQELLEVLVKITSHCKDTLDTTPDEIIADYRYGFVTALINKGVLIRNGRSTRIEISDKIDKVMTNTFAGPLIMLSILYGMFVITFSLGEYPMGWLESFFGVLGDAMTAIMPEGILQSLVVSGIIAGVGGVLGFVPLILIMFFMVAILEDSGYMARIAYILDKVMQMVGLHGASVMPYIISGGIVGGCAVPGVMATRTLKSPKEKLATILTAPYLTCGAKTPVVMLLAAAFFPHDGARVLFFTVLLGWTVALLVARFLRSTLIRGDSTPFVMELPPYRLPTLKGVLIHTWERAWEYIKKAGTVILAISILLWAAMTFPRLPSDQKQEFQAERDQVTSQMKTINNTDQKIALSEAILKIDNKEAATALRHSIAGRVGTTLEGVSSLAGFDWRVNIALLGGFAAKEVIVASLGTAYSLGEVDPEASDKLSERLREDPNWNFLTALSLLVFVMLYSPCFVTVVAIAKETSWKWAGFSMVFNTVIAFVLSVAVYQIGSLLIT